MLISSRNRTGNNQWSSCLINQNAIHLIDHGVMMTALHQLLRIASHIVAQVIETKFIVGSINNISAVCRFPFFGIWLVLIDTIHIQPMKLEDMPHPLTVAPVEIL